MSVSTHLSTLGWVRNRCLLALWLIFVIALGLLSRKFPHLFPQVLGKYPGDALWSMMVYCGLALVRSSGSPSRVAGLSFLISVLDELTQLIQIPWLNAIRQTTLGHLVLGSVFSWQDILAYLVGILIAVLLDIVLFSQLFNRFKSTVSSNTSSEVNRL
jgi:hypothetical protein